VSAINALGGAAKGFSGPIFSACRKTRVMGADGGPIDLGFVGEVVGVNTSARLECIENGVTPVISPTARAEDGRIYNCKRGCSRGAGRNCVEGKKAGFHERCIDYCDFPSFMPRYLHLVRMRLTVVRRLINLADTSIDRSATCSKFTSQQEIWPAM